MRKQLDNINWPAIPEGYFFRVIKGPLGQYPWVELRRKLKWFGSIKVDAAWQKQFEFPTAAAEIEHIAKYLTSKNRHALNGEHIIGDSK